MDARKVSLVFVWVLFAFFLSWSAASAAGGEGEKVFPNRSTKPLLSEDKLEIVAELPSRPGNVDVDPDTETVFFTFHPFGDPNPPCKVCILHDKTKYSSFGNQSLFESVLSIRVSPRKRQLLVLDHKNYGEKNPVLYVLSIIDGSPIRAIVFSPEVAGKGSFLNDFVISKDETFVFIADSSMGADPSIITVDMRTGEAMKSLVNHESTKVRGTPNQFAINGTVYNFDFQVGVDSIGLSADGNTLYFGSLFDPFMWMVPTRNLILRNPTSFVDVAFPKPTSDGIIVDEATGLLYVTDFQNSAIWVTNPGIPGRSKTVIISPKLLRWPDGLSIAKGYLYITASALYELMPETKWDRPPFHILRFRLLQLFEKDHSRAEL